MITQKRFSVNCQWLVLILVPMALLFALLASASAGTVAKPCPSCLDQNAGWYFMFAGNDAQHSIWCSSCRVPAKMEDCNVNGANVCEGTARCIFCDQLIGPLGHDWSSWAYSGHSFHYRICLRDAFHDQRESCHADNESIRLPTCAQYGERSGICSTCKSSYSEILTDPIHAWEAWTDNGNGTHTRKCGINPQHTQTETCAYTDSVIPSTCMLEGYTVHTCMACGDGYEDTSTKALGHAWGALAANGNGTHARICGNDPQHTQAEACSYTDSVIPPACMLEGYTAHTCTACGYSYKDTSTKALGHAWGAWTAKGNGTHARICGNDSQHTQAEACVYVDTAVPATCINDGQVIHTCSICGYSYQEKIAALGHVPGKWVKAVAPTVSRRGRKEIGCTRCGAVLQQAALPRLSTKRKGDIAVVAGTLLRDLRPGLAGGVYTCLPLDLTKQGISEYPLIAANRYQIGKVVVDIHGETVTVRWESPLKSLHASQELMNWFAGPEEITSLDTVTLQQTATPFGAGYSIRQLPQKDGHALLLIQLVVDYDTRDEACVLYP